MPKISVIGICGNSVFMYVDHFHMPEETLVADSVFEEIGGKGINQAIAAKRMGADVSFLCAVGDDDNGIKCMRETEANNINAHFKIKNGKSTPLAFILTDKKGENRVTVHKSAELSADDVISFESEIASSDILLLQHEVPDEVNLKAVEIANKYKVKVILNPAPIRTVSDEVNLKAVEIAKKYSVKVILNPAPIRTVSDEISKNVFIVTPNEQEKQAIDISCFQNCIATLGKKGCLVNEETLVPSIDVKAVDTTGAGDTFNGVLSVCIAEGMDLENACRYAVTASGISVGRKYVLNAIPYREEIERMLENE